jgi:O-antigen ligase
MGIVELYFFAHLVLRSFTNGLDRIYSFQSSIALSIVAIAVGLIVAIHFASHVSIPRQVYKLILSLMAFIFICFLSYAINGFAEDNIRSQYHAWYSIIQHFYLLAVIILVSCIYRSPTFCRNVYWACVIVIVVNTCAAAGQFATGHTILVTPYDKYARVAGLSAHPVTFSLEMAIVFFVCELSRRKLQRPFNWTQAAVWVLTVAALILSASRTGIMLLGLVLGAYYLIRRPILLPIFAVAAIAVIVASPFETLFSELRTVPHYIWSGDFTTWDYHTAPTSVHWRIHHWYYMTSLGLTHPWLGFGPGQETLYSPFSLEAHSQFVEIFVEMGLIGLAVYCYFWYLLATVALSKSDSKNRKQKSSSDSDLRTLWLLTFVGITLGSMFDESFNLETVSFTFLIVSIFVMLAPSPTTVTARVQRPLKAEMAPAMA